QGGGDGGQDEQLVAHHDPVGVVAVAVDGPDEGRRAGVVDRQEGAQAVLGSGVDRGEADRRGDHPEGDAEDPGGQPDPVAAERERPRLPRPGDWGPSPPRRGAGRPGPGGPRGAPPSRGWPPTGAPAPPGAAPPARWWRMKGCSGVGGWETSDRIP